MKLLTINTHSIVEPDYEKKLNDFVEKIIQEQPDIIGMQEVNQSQNESVLNEENLKGMVSCGVGNVLIRKDNHAARVAKMLWERGIFYYWSWLPLKTGYGKYDEGLAVFSKHPITKTEVFQISNCDDYGNWKTRKVLGICSNQDWFYTVHMGWWNDEEEPFLQQWKRLNEKLRQKQQQMRKTIGKQRNIWLMGDFNSQAEVRGEGYDCVCGSGWLDTYCMADEKDTGITVEENIDGWKDKEGIKQMRIDYIFCNSKVPVKSSRVVFNGKNAAKISDHYGVIIEV